MTTNCYICGYGTTICDSCKKYYDVKEIEKDHGTCPIADYAPVQLDVPTAHTLSLSEKISLLTRKHIVRALVELGLSNEVLPLDVIKYEIGEGMSDTVKEKVVQYWSEHGKTFP